MRAVLDHIGIAVKDLRAALAFYRDALGLEIEASEEVASQAVRAHFVRVGEASLELLEATAPESAIARYVDKRGPGLHHITLRVDDIAAALAQLKARNVRLIDDRPRPGAENALVAFIHPSSAHGVLVELKQAGAARRAGTAGGAGGAETAGGAGAAESAGGAGGAGRVGRAGAAAGAPDLIGHHVVGDLELVALYDGFFRVDGGAMFGVVPKPLWAAEARPDDENRVALAVRPLLVRGVRTLLIDAGIGDVDATFADEYGIDRAHPLDAALAETGVAPESIDIVLATHLHFDHAGGFMRRDAAGRPRPRFPRAQYVVRRGEWETAMQSHEANRSGYVRDQFAPLAAAGVLALVDEDQTIMPGVRVQRSGGDTMHHQIVWIESRDRRAVYVGDLMPTRAHARDEWISAFDLYPTDTLTAKRAVARAAAEQDTLVFFPHDPAIAGGRLVEEDGQRRVVPAG
jgi:methylmalonyl-CoA epimerase